jgi:hypothetical protein
MFLCRRRKGQRRSGTDCSLLGISASRGMGCTMRLLLLLLVGAGSSRAVDNGVGSVPIMGFDAWYAFSQYSSGPCGGTYHNAPGAFNYSRALTETAEVMVSGGYREAGYRVVGPSDGSAAKQRGPGGEYRLDPGPWPGGMQQVQAFSDWLHDKMGLQFGWYSARGDNTCCGRIASCGFEEQDAKQFAKWRVDFLFHDSCGSCKAHPKDTPVELYGRMERALNATGYRTYLKAGWPSEAASDPSNPAFDVPQRGAVANDWRICSDDGGGISILKRCWDIAAPLWRYAGKGQWNDPGMLVSGSGMTDEQTRTQFNMAAILPAQLMIGIDIRNASSYLRATLLNKEVIKVCVCVCACVRVRARVCACVRATP